MARRECDNSHNGLSEMSSFSTPFSPSVPAPTLAGHRRAWILFALAGAAVLLVALWGAGHVGRKQAHADLLDDASAAAALKVTLLTSELDKQRSLPFVLAQDSEVKGALLSGDPAGYQALNLKFEALSRDTGAAVIYLLDLSGTGVAASNWNSPASFVGSNFAFRPYFQGAVHAGRSEYFALGNVSNEPGLYLARRLEQDGRPLGVIVVKVEFGTVEAGWRKFPAPVFVTDERGVVLLSSVESWRFLTERPLSPEEREALRTSLQFGDAPLTPLPLRPDSAGRVTVQLPGRDEEPFLHVQAPVPGEPWQFHLLSATGEATERAVADARLKAALAVLCTLLAAGIWMHRRHRIQDRVRAQEAIRQELESRVAARTRELREANAQLRAEMEDRQRAEAELHSLQEELVQANKLAFLGQITAGVAHEINQPVAAIRSYADNSAVFLERGVLDRVRGNMAAIAALTERIGVITDELRTFSRKSAPVADGRVPVEVAIDGALTLVGFQLRRRGIALHRSASEPGLAVKAERVRLEQVLVNLLQNAIDALEQAAEPRITVSAYRDGSRVALVVADNGPGLPESITASLFTPFQTTKPRGLGLGLVISRDIVADFGGSLSVQSQPGCGARFTIHLPEATS